MIYRNQLNPLLHCPTKTGWLTDPDKGFDVCSADSGKTWYAKEATGLLAPPSADDAKQVYSTTTATPTFMAPAAR
jgi:hypothetical protein